MLKKIGNKLSALWKSEIAVVIMYQVSPMIYLDFLQMHSIVYYLNEFLCRPKISVACEMIYFGLNYYLQLYVSEEVAFVHLSLAAYKKTDIIN